MTINPCRAWTRPTKADPNANAMVQNGVAVAFERSPREIKIPLMLAPVRRAPRAEHRGRRLEQYQPTN